MSQWAHECEKPNTVAMEKKKVEEDRVGVSPKDQFQIKLSASGRLFKIH